MTNVISLAAYRAGIGDAKPTSSRTWSSLATSRHRLSVDFRKVAAELGDARLLEQAEALLAEAKKLDEFAHEARLREERGEEEHRRTAATLAMVLEVTERETKGTA